MSSLKVALETYQPRERSGGWTTARYAFQAHFAILEMLDRHKSNDNYCVLLDYLDDVVVVDNPSSPKAAKFYQVKAKASGRWTVFQVCKTEPKKAAPTSIIGKIQYNVSDFGAFVLESMFITNASFNFKLLNGKQSADDDFVIKISDLHKDEIATIDSTLNAESPPPRPHDCKSLIKFRRIALGVHEQDKFVIGSIASYLASRKSDSDVPAIGVYETLYAKVVQKSSVTKTLTKSEDIFSEKGLQGLEVERLFQRAIESNRILADWGSIETELLSTMNRIKAARVKTNCIRYLRARSNGEAAVASVSRALQNAAQVHKAELEKCTDFLEARSKLLSWTKQVSLGDAELIAAAALVEAYEELVFN